jgi:predicted RNase H-like nuclease (RuvC/YqgF family)
MTFLVFSAFLVAKPSNKIQKLKDEKFALNLELAKIKSIQASLVQHSKLNRKVIKLDKEIEKLEIETGPKHKKVKKLFRFIRVLQLFWKCQNVLMFLCVVDTDLRLRGFDCLHVGYAAGCV